MTNAEARFNNSLHPRKPEGSFGRTAQDVHLDSHTAPELYEMDSTESRGFIGIFQPKFFIGWGSESVTLETSLLETCFHPTQLARHDHYKNLKWRIVFQNAVFDFMLWLGTEFHVVMVLRVRWKLRIVFQNAVFDFVVVFRNWLHGRTVLWLDAWNSYGSLVRCMKQLSARSSLFDVFSSG